MEKRWGPTVACPCRCPQMDGPIIPIIGGLNIIRKSVNRGMIWSSLDCYLWWVLRGFVSTTFCP